MFRIFFFFAAYLTDDLKLVKQINPNKKIKLFLFNSSQFANVEMCSVYALFAVRNSNNAK